MGAGLLQIDGHPHARGTPQSRFTLARQLVLVALCLLWFFPGTIERGLWKPAESRYVPLAYENEVAGWSLPPAFLGQPQAGEAPLYLYLGAKAGAALSGMTDFHVGMRMANLAWLALGLALVGLPLAQRHGSRVGWRAILLVIGSLGLLLHARTVTPDVALLLVSGLGLYGMHLLGRARLAGGLLLGLGALIGFLAVGALALYYILALLLLSLVLPGGSGRRWQAGHSLALVLGALAFAAWQNLLAGEQPELLASYNHALVAKLAPLALLSSLQSALLTACWFTWPALPLAVMSYIRWRYRRPPHSEVPLGMLGLAAGVVALTLAGMERDSQAILLLPALAVIAAAGVQGLSTDIAKMLDWFAVLVIGFGMIGFCWLGWLALTLGSPAGLVSWLAELGIGEAASGDRVVFAALFSLLWLAMILRIGRSPERAVLNWVVGLSMGWLVFFLLWGKQVDQIKSYRLLAQQLEAALPPASGCVSYRDVPATLIGQLGYYSTIGFVAPPEGARCSWWVAGQGGAAAATERWRGRRPGEGEGATIFLMQRKPT